MEFAYGLAEVLLDDERIGYIEKGSFDLGARSRKSRTSMPNRCRMPLYWSFRKVTEP
jgi:hypothetical protein